MKRYDIETFLSEFGTFLRGNLNDQITSLNTEKADAITLAPVDTDSAYFLQSLSGKIVNVDPFLVYGLFPPRPESVGSMAAENHEVFIVLVVSNPGTESADSVLFRMLRYQRALKELVEAKWDTISNYRIVPGVNRLNPFPPDIEGIGENAMAVGIVLSISIG